MKFNQTRLGIDFGNVIQGRNPVTGSDDTNFLGSTVKDAVQCPALPGALEGVRALVGRFGGRVWIVSKARAKMQRKTLAWLDHNDWWRLTGMNPWSIAFVLEREQKREVAKDLGLTHFIDDRNDVLSALYKDVENLYWFGQQGLAGVFTAMPDWSHAHIVR